PAKAANPTPPFTQCPAIGLDTSCRILIVINPGGTLTVLQDSSQPPYEGSEDTLVGVVNQSGATVSSISLSSSTDIFGFDGDGICAVGISPQPAGCPFGPTEYEGPNTSFSNINGTGTSGNVDFPSGLSDDTSTYFSLEEDLQASDIQPGGGGPSTVSGTKYYDANANGQLDPGEVGLANWPIDIGQNGITSTIPTDSNGNFTANV